MSAARGHLIVFEGLDRSGKSTQCEQLVSFLRSQGASVEHMRFPDRTTVIGQMINNYLKGDTQQEDHAIHLLFSANRWEAAPKIQQLIASGTSVVVDRYYYSGCVYSAAKQQPHLDLAWCRQPEVGLPRPDLCVFLDISAEQAARRGGFGAERYEEPALQARVRALFAELRAHRDEAADTVVVDAGGSVALVQHAVQHAVQARLAALTADPHPLRQIQAW